MIGYIKGKIVQNFSNAIVVDTGGVGYKVFVGGEIKPVGEPVELFIYHHVREDANDLFGFQSPADLQIFELLLTVSGVGPKAGLNIIANLGRENILAAISKNDPSLFKTVSGIGAKVAAKIVLELKGKIDGGAGEIVMPQDDETVEALVGLGYKRHEIIPYLKEIPADKISVSDKVKYVLKNVGKKK